MIRTVDGRGRPLDELVGELRGLRPGRDRARRRAREILARVARQGDAALEEYARKFEGRAPDRLLLGPRQLAAAARRVPVPLREALVGARNRIARFHRPQRARSYEISVGPAGSRAGQLLRPLRRVGIYVPGGPRGYPSTVLMGVVPARLAGVPSIVVATPASPGGGAPSDAVLAAAHLAGATELLVAGGAQAVGALAYGTQSVRPVDMIVGPGNPYVTEAKRLVSDRVVTDAPAGPSEVVVLADASFPTHLVAAELLAQAEHAEDSTAGLLLLDDRPSEEVDRALEAAVQRLGRRRPITRSLRRHGWIVRNLTRRQAIGLANALAPEHLVLGVRRPRMLLGQVVNAGCVFLGPASAVPFGDYGVGTNHILPTAGAAVGRGALGVRDFQKPVSYLEVAPGDVRRLSGPALRLAEVEGFSAHAAAIRARIAPRPARRGP
ncbi:MAG: histidinol dehydrogenase [Thermoplasmata archaeon]